MSTNKVLFLLGCKQTGCSDSAFIVVYFPLDSTSYVNKKILKIAFINTFQKCKPCLYIYKVVNSVRPYMRNPLTEILLEELGRTKEMF